MASRLANPKCRNVRLPDVIVDLGGSVKVIDCEADLPCWKIVARLNAATTPNAVRALRIAGLSEGWLFDDLGNRQFVSRAMVLDATYQ